MTTTTTEDEKAITKHEDAFSLHLKPEYVLKARSTSLPSLAAADTREDDTERRGDNNNNNAKKGKRERGRNKKRPRDVRINDADKVCLAVMRGETCSYGAEKCRFTHDLKAYLAIRPPDIEVEGISKCPNFELHGFCQYGAMCRFGASHINMATGHNLKVELETIPPLPVLNALSTELQTQLRKNTYPFVCQRKNKAAAVAAAAAAAAVAASTDNEESKVETIGQPSEMPNGEKEEASLSSVVDYSPLPTKTRKIIDFSNKVYVAPLTTVGNLPFRRIMKKFGADITCGEMALATNLLEGKASEWALIKRHPEEDVFGIQLAAGYPDIFTRTMELVETHVSVDFVDLNLGCPLDLVCNKGSGAALMMRDKRLKASLEGIARALTKCPVTIKMRTGWDEKAPLAHELVPKIQSWGFGSAAGSCSSSSSVVGAIMIHGRSRLQRYSKEANWEYVSQVACSQDSSLPTIPVIGNGDILSFTDYEEKVERSEGVWPCAMLGRGALIKPWLPTEIKERRHWDISATERLDILRDFVRFGLQHWGSDQQGVNNCRRFLLEWLSFLHRYVPVGLLEQSQPQRMNQRPPKFLCGRSDLETLFSSDHCGDWIKISEMLLGPVPEGFRFEPKHKANSYRAE
jgi:tRNA-dihydrouridine synthase 3